MPILHSAMHKIDKKPDGNPAILGLALQNSSSAHNPSRKKTNKTPINLCRRTYF
ncbi:Hypothetical protein PSEBR_cmegl71 [Pseudomonas brassicacearum subsp. brassicacearum NFM421]|uniref:Uncharacterized protein n=1 Tax=Pseudomonas brassicacearum (strain NFM421) TaxID=994484 RepID=F2KJK3_PSEBN|nr:Hypothetical protein PSEBR_cmegl71 [Pseudomonas brassicacearum subsp. brassicacearum NFM421]